MIFFKLFMAYPFSVIETKPYLKEPKITIIIPSPLSNPTASPKYKIQNATNNTCFTFAAIHKVRAEVTLLAIKDDTLSEKDKIPDRSTT